MILEKIIELHDADKLPPMVKMPGKRWYRDLPGGWAFAVNAADSDWRCEPQGSMACTVRPGDFVFWFNGWIAGIMSLVGGGTIAAGEAANEDTLLAALDQAIAEVAARG